MAMSIKKKDKMILDGGFVFLYYHMRLKETRSLTVHIFT